jgi:hypothetical protein
MHLAEFTNAEKDLLELEKLLPGESQVEKLKKELEIHKEKYNKEKKALFKKGLFKSGLYEDVKIKEKGPYPELDLNNLFVYLDILVGFKSANFKDARKIKIEIYKNFHKDIALYFFELVDKNKEFFRKKFFIKRFEKDVYGLSLIENLENQEIKLTEEKNNLPLTGSGLLILRKSNKEVFINLNGFPKVSENYEDYLVIGKVCYNDKYLSDIYKEITISDGLDVNDFLFNINDHGKALTI